LHTPTRQQRLLLASFSPTSPLLFWPGSSSSQRLRLFSPSPSPSLPSLARSRRRSSRGGRAEWETHTGVVAPSKEDQPCGILTTRRPPRPPRRRRPPTTPARPPRRRPRQSRYPTTLTTTPPRTPWSRASSSRPRPPSARRRARRTRARAGSAWPPRRLHRPPRAATAPRRLVARRAGAGRGRAARSTAASRSTAGRGGGSRTYGKFRCRRPFLSRRGARDGASSSSSSRREGGGVRYWVGFLLFWAFLASAAFPFHSNILSKLFLPAVLPCQYAAMLFLCPCSVCPLSLSPTISHSPCSPLVLV